MKEGATVLNKGKIVQVSGPVVDVEFKEGRLPKLREALTGNGRW